MARTQKQRTRDNELVELALLGKLLPAEAREPGAQRIHCKVAGVTATNADGSSRQAVIEHMAQFEHVHLVRNPADPHDENAIQVHAEIQRGGSMLKSHIGHIPWELAAELAPSIDAGQNWKAIATRVGGSYGTLGVSIMLYRASNLTTSN